MEHSSAKPLIYFVDDELDLLDVFQSAFEERYAVSTFSSAEQLVGAISSGQVPTPQLIVTDFRMTGMDGVKMLAALMSMGHPIPAILLSGNLSKETAISALNHGFFRILEKPFEPDVLESFINELLLEVKVHKAREEIRISVRKLNEIHQAMRLLLSSRIENYEEIVNEAVKGSGLEVEETFEGIVARLESRLDALLKTEEMTEMLRRSPRVVT